MEDEVIKKQSIIIDLKKQDLNKLSINELQERILSLKEEIDRAEEKIEFKKLSKSNAESIFKVGEGRPNVVDGIKNGKIQLVINTPLGAQSRYDEYKIGWASIRYKITVITTISGAQAAVRGIRNIKSGSIEYRSLQEVFC